MHRPVIRIFFVLLLAGCQQSDDSYWQGYVEGEYVMLASPYAGQLQKLHVRRGEQAQAGKPMFALEQESERAARLEAEQRVKSAQARLENLGVPRREPEIEALRADLRQAQVALQLAQTNLAREEDLVKAGATSRLRYDELRSAVDRDRARVAEAQAQLRQAQMPVGFRATGAPAGRRDAVKARPSAAGDEALRRSVWGNQTDFRHSLEREIEHAGPDLHPPVGLRRDFLDDAEAVAAVVSERQQDVEPVIGQRSAGGERVSGAARGHGIGLARPV